MSKKKIPTVEQLRKNGFKVKIIHDRILDANFDMSLCPNGGITIVSLRTPDDEELEGRASCSVQDSYNKKLGTKIALGRALKGINWSKFIKE